MRKNIPEHYTDAEIHALVDHAQLAVITDRTAEAMLSGTRALGPFGCTWHRCVVPCDSQAEHEGKAKLHSV